MCYSVYMIPWIDQDIYVEWCFLLLLLPCNFVAATTTKLHMKKNNKNKKINLHTFSVQFINHWIFWLLLLLLCKCVVATTKVHMKKHNKNKKIKLPTFSFSIINNWIFWLFLLYVLLLFLLLCSFVVATTTKLHIEQQQQEQKGQSTYISVQLSITPSFCCCNNNKLHMKKQKEQRDQSTYIFCSITKLRRQMTIRHTWLRCTPC